MTENILYRVLVENDWKPWLQRMCEASLWGPTSRSGTWQTCPSRSLLLPGDRKDGWRRWKSKCRKTSFWKLFASFFSSSITCSFLVLYLPSLKNIEKAKQCCRKSALESSQKCKRSPRHFDVTWFSFNLIQVGPFVRVLNALSWRRRPSSVHFRFCHRPVGRFDSPHFSGTFSFPFFPGKRFQVDDF